MHEKDFVWPPSDADLAACGVLPGSARARDVDLRVVVHIADVLRPPAGPVQQQQHRLSPDAHAPRFRHWGVEQPEAAYPFHIDGDPLVPYGRSTAEAWRAVLALAAGLSLALLSLTQFRGARGESRRAEPTAARARAAAPDTRVLGPVAAAADLVEDAAPPPPVGERPRVQQRGNPASAQPAVAAPAARVLDGTPRLEAHAAAAIPELVEPRPEAAAMPAAPAVIELAQPVAYLPEPITAAVPSIDPLPGDEDHIHGALTRWRAAYSALDASAAREVWPSVDARALERAFQALKSQELRFDRCNVAVDGSSARAICSGQAIYVPRVGRQSSRAMSREWTFELKKADQRWTIASASSR
jgi:hypothetical protein